MGTPPLSVTIKKLQDNIESLFNGGYLCDQDEIKLKFVGIILEEDSGDGLEFTLEQFSELVKFVEPMSERETAMKSEIDRLLGLLEDATTYSGTNKRPIQLTAYQEIQVAKWYADESATSNVKVKISEVATRFNISSTYASRILTEHGVRTPNTRNRQRRE